MSERFDAVVVGAGPAGLGAALELSQRGFRTFVADEYPVAGGRLLGQRYQVGRRHWNGREVAQGLLEEVSRHPAAILHTRTTVYEVVQESDGFRVRTHPHGDVSARTVLVATGASERPVPVPGWTLPGVLTVGGGQVMAVVHKVLPGRRGMIVGTGPLSFAISAELSEAGVAWMGMAMAPPVPATRHLGSTASQWRALAALRSMAPPLLRPAVRLMGHDSGRRAILPFYPRRGVQVSGAQLFLTEAVTRIFGEASVQAVELRRLRPDGTLTRRRRVVPVDFVLLAGGLAPITELLYPLGAAMTDEAGLGGTVPLLGPDGETTVPGVYVAGNAGGVESGPVALQQGRVTGLAMAKALDPASEEIRAALARARENLVQERDHAPFEFVPGARDARERVIAQWHEDS